MTTLGQVTAGREAVVHLTVEGAGGTNREINAVLDTGFNGYLALPAPLIEALGLQGLGRERVTLASGEIRFTSSGSARGIERSSLTGADVCSLGPRRCPSCAKRT